MTRCCNERTVARAGARALAAGVVVLCALSMGGATCGMQSAPTKTDAALTLKAVLGPGDVVSIRVFNEPELSGDYQITPEGAIRMPLVGDVPVSGMTADQVTATVEAALNEKYLKDAQVTVFVKEYTSLRVYVLGEVGKPGPQPYQSRMTLIDAIANAGGTTKLADADRTILTRDDNGEQQRLSVPVGSIGKGSAPDVQLLPGDIIFVPETLF